MSKILFLTPKGKLLSLSVINRVQQITDGAAVKFMIRRNITSTPIRVLAVRGGASGPEQHRTTSAEQSKVCVALLKCLVIAASCFYTALKVELPQYQKLLLLFSWYTQNQEV